jgi:hypothetical protein
MSRWLVATWLANLAPLVIAGISGGPEGVWGHAVFHVGYIAFILAGLAFLWQLRLASTSRAVRAASVGVAVAQVLFIAGQVGELAVVMNKGGEGALVDPGHEFVAVALTGPGLILSLVGLLVLTALVVVAQRRATDRRPSVHP